MRKLLIANRGEIAVRIIETAALRGLQTVAIYPDDDRTTAHVARADESVLLPGSGVAAYLDVEAVIEAAKESHADAVHPGFGFLSENPTFARRLAEEGITFVGPSADLLELFGDKSNARAQAVAAGVPVGAGTTGPTTLEQAREFFDGLGPDAAVMVKALAGGGGRGMAPVRDAAELEPAFKRCSAEALAAFGSGDLYVEQLLPRARHIEVQIVADGQGGVVALGDRDCSAQRRRQKLLEIAPAPWISDDVRRRLHDAATAIVGSTAYAGLATVEFLVQDDDLVFLEVNPRIQVEHTVTEEVTGVDLVDAALQIADGATLTDLGIAQTPAPRGSAMQARVNAEVLAADGTVTAGVGRLTRFQPPSGRGVRVDTHGYSGYVVTPRYDSLLAKVIVSDRDLAGVIRKAQRALDEFDLSGIETNIPVLQAILARPDFGAGEVTTAYVDGDLAAILDEAAAHTQPEVEEAEAAITSRAAQVDVPDAAVGLAAPMQAVVVEIPVKEGDFVARGTEIVILEAMKMQHVVTADRPGVVHTIAVDVGDVVDKGDFVLYLEETEDDGAAAAEQEEVDLDRIRPDLQESIDRHRFGLDEGRVEAVAKRHAKGRRTARENIAQLVDDGSFIEYGALTIAAQRRRRSLEDLIERTSGDGIVLGTATIDGVPVAVMSYDYLVMAGTQGFQNHRKTDRFLELAGRQNLPLVMFAEGGGGRPGDTDVSAVAQLDVPTFRTLAGLVGKIPIVGIVSGYCFAGNAALVGSCDIVIATKDASLGMGGPAMIEGGGLGVYHPDEVGPMSVQYPNGVVDVLVDEESEAIEIARDAITLLAGKRSDEVTAADQRVMRHLIPENRLRSYDVRPIVQTFVDEGSLIELRRPFGIGILTALGRLDGKPIGIIANNPHHLGGAIDAEAADKAARFLTMCQDHQLPVLSFVDTPGFMVGPESEKEATVRRFGAFFVAGARMTTPIYAVVLRKGYGLGAQAMCFGSTHAPLLTASWPTGEFGGMGLEGAVRLGFRKELEAIEDMAARKQRYEELLEGYYQRGKALNMASVFEIDDVIDPADTRAVIAHALTIAP